MAPRKTKVDGDAKGKGKAVVTPSTRMTRSMDRKTRSETRRSGAGSSSSKFMKLESPEKNKKRKTTAKKDGGPKKKVKEEETDKEEEPTEEDDVAAEEEDDVAAKVEDDVAKKIVIEHCKQCNSFKVRAGKVKKGLEEAVPGIKVTVNAVKPRRGCFEIREEGGETFISLLDMKRPFKPMKDLDMEQVIADILEKIN